MNIKEKIDQLNKAHQENIDAILAMLNSNAEYDKDFCAIANWIVTNEHNPYGYMDEHWAGAISTSSGLDSFLSNLHHAMVDDGDVCFIRIELNSNITEYKIMFVDWFDIKDSPTKIVAENDYYKSRYADAKLTRYDHIECMQWVKDFEFTQSEWKTRCEKFDQLYNAFRNQQRS